MGGCLSVEKKPNSAGKPRAGTPSDNEDHSTPSRVKRSHGAVNDRDRTVGDAAFTSRYSSARSPDTGPVKENHDEVYGGDRSGGNVAHGSRRSPASPPYAGAKDESFFETRSWVESESEDDYFSLDGDFTPTCGTTPVHSNSSPGNLQANNPHPVEQSNGFQESSPSGKKKRLAELFKESRRSLQPVAGGNKIECPDEEVAKASTTPCELTFMNDTIYPHSGSSSDNEIPNKKVQSVDGLKSVPCCIPGLIASRRSVDRRRKKSLLQSQNSIEQLQSARILGTTYNAGADL